MRDPETGELVPTGPPSDQVIMVTRVDPGRIPAMYDPADVEIVVHEGRNQGVRLPFGTIEGFERSGLEPIDGGCPCCQPR